MIEGSSREYLPFSDLKIHEKSQQRSESTAGNVN